MRQKVIYCIISSCFSHLPSFSVCLRSTAPSYGGAIGHPRHVLLAGTNSAGAARTLLGKADDNDSDVYDAVEIREGLYRAARNAFTDVIEATPPPGGGACVAHLNTGPLAAVLARFSYATPG